LMELYRNSDNVVTIQINPNHEIEIHSSKQSTKNQPNC